MLSKTLSANNFLTYVLLAFIAMSGLSYINFLPAVVNALADGIGFSGVQAGRVVAFNGYGGILGSVGAIFLAHRIRWRPAIAVSFVILALFDLSTIWLSKEWENRYSSMLCWRFLAGIVGGFCTGIAFSVLARLKKPDRAFGLLLFVQFSVGSLVIYSLPGLEVLLNEYAVFYIMAAIAVLSMVFLLFLPILPTFSESVRKPTPLLRQLVKSRFLLLAILFYQIAASAIWAYVGLMGLNTGNSAESVSAYIAMTGLLGLLGAMLPVLLPVSVSHRLLRLYYLIAGISVSAASAVMLNFSQFTLNYIVSMALLFFCWPVVQAYLLAETAFIDSSGRLSATAALVSSVGLASGPLFASFVLDRGGFSVMLYCCAVIFTLIIFLVLMQKNIGSYFIAREL